MPEKDKLADLEFPLGGMEVAREFQEQSPGTTPNSTNCRGINPDSLRNRGGSRAGLVKYVPTVIPADLAESLLIQHLNVIVDPQAEALRQNFPTPDDTWVEDPHNPGFYVPPGGWGNQPNPNATPNAPPTVDEIEFVQMKVNALGSSTPATLDDVPATGNLLIACVVQIGATGATVSVPGYTQVGGYVEVFFAGSQFTVSSMWRKISAGAGDQSVTPVASDEGATNAYCALYLSEYTNNHAVPLVDVQTATGSSPASIQTGNVQTEDGGMVIILTGNFDSSSVTGTSPTFSFRGRSASGSIGVADRVSIDSATEDPLNTTISLGLVAEIGIIAASFRKA